MFYEGRYNIAHAFCVINCPRVLECNFMWLGVNTDG